MLGTGHAFTNAGDPPLHGRAGEVVEDVQASPRARLRVVRAPPVEDAVRSDLEIDLLAGFVLSTVSSMTELAIDEPDHRWPDGEQLWQLIADGIT